MTGGYMPSARLLESGTSSVIICSNPDAKCCPIHKRGKITSSFIVPTVTPVSFILMSVAPNGIRKDKKSFIFDMSKPPGFS
jgi:hypothetical protein